MIHIIAVGAGGIEAYYLNAMKRLQNTDMEFSVVTCYRQRETVFEEQLRELGIPFVYQGDGTSRIGYNESLNFLLNEIERQKPDIVDLNHSSGQTFYFGHKIKQRFPSVKVVHISHGDSLGGKYVFAKYIVFGFWRWLYEKESDYRIGCSKQILDWTYTKRPDCGGHDPLVLHCSIETERHKFNPSARETYRQKLGISDDTILVGTIGRMCFQKNSLFVVDIVRKLADKNFGFKFLWVGVGEDEQAVKDKAHKLGLDDKIIFFGVSNDVPGLLSAMDIFILPSRWEGLPLSGVEAQASGLYAVASETITPETKVVDGKYFVLPLGDAGVWADKIEEISGKDLTDRRYPEKELEERGFNPDTNARKLGEIFRTVYAEKESQK